MLTRLFDTFVIRHYPKALKRHGSVKIKDRMAVVAKAKEAEWQKRKLFDSAQFLDAWTVGEPWTIKRLAELDTQISAQF